MSVREVRKSGSRQCAGPSEKRAVRQPWLRFGPGMVLALLAGVLIWNGMPRQPGPPPSSPGVIRETAPGPKGPPSAPDPAWLLTQAEPLGLTPEQTAKLTRLERRWDRDTRDLRARIDAAQAEFERGMREREGQPASMQELQERAAPVSDLSRQLASARRAWWSEASGALTPGQRQKAETMWVRRFEAESGSEANR